MECIWNLVLEVIKLVEMPKNIQIQEVQKALTRCARDVHLLEAPALEDADGQLPGGGDISVN